MKQKVLSILALLLMAVTGAWAQSIPTASATLTVYEGTKTDSRIPLYGFYADSKFCSQYIIPAADLAAMDGATISALTYYLDTPAKKAFAVPKNQNL